MCAIAKGPEAAPFRFLLRLDDDEQTHPLVFVTFLANWKVGETFLMGDQSLRILGIETEIAGELAESGFNGIFTVEPA